MKPHPRPPIIRKTIKWGGAAVTVLLVVVWAASVWHGVSWYGKSGNGFFYIERGGATCLSTSLAVPPELKGLTHWHLTHWRPPDPFRLCWWPRFIARRGADWALTIPLWMPTALASSLFMGAWRREYLAHRRERDHLCPKCNYDRTGILKDAKCPECGAVPAGV
jgi:hypothetical protein